MGRVTVSDSVSGLLLTVRSAVSRWGIADAESEVPSVENPELSKALASNRRQNNVDLHALPAANISYFFFFPSWFAHLRFFFAQTRIELKIQRQKSWRIFRNREKEKKKKKKRKKYKCRERLSVCYNEWEERKKERQKEIQV